MRTFSLSIILSVMVAVASAATINCKLPQTLEKRSLSLTFQKKVAKGDVVIRAFNAIGGGFVITSSGSATDRIIGYSTTGRFSYDDAPEAFKAWFEAQANAPVSQAPARKFAPVGPLCSTKWNQAKPYNDQCPYYDVNTICATGCVATAMAQVMKYHRWPEHGTGTHSYEPVVMSGNNLSIDFSATNYRWDEMIDEYIPGQYTMAQGSAVAELMLHCGVAVDMVYYNSSGANDYDVPRALTTYFGYDRGISYRKREHYSINEWYDVLEAEFNAGRPVLAYGRSSSGGHAFVFDGIDENGLIHVNWGWSGVSDGYFRMTDLTPLVQGIGGSDGGYNYSQRILTGVFADKGTSDYDVELTSTEGLTAGKSRITNGGSLSMKLAGKVTNQGWRDADFDYALMLLAENGDTVQIDLGPKDQKLEMNATVYAPTFGNVSYNLPAGNYTLYPACRQTGGKGRWNRVRDSYISYPNYLRVTSDGTNVKFTAPDYFDLSIKSTDIPSAISNKDTLRINAVIENKGDVEYHGQVNIALYNASTKKQVMVTSGYVIDVLPEGEASLTFTDRFDVEPGSYYFIFINDDKQSISKQYPVVVSNVSDGIESITTASQYNNNKEYDLTGKRATTKRSIVIKNRKKALR